MRGAPLVALAVLIITLSAFSAHGGNGIWDPRTPYTPAPVRGVQKILVLLVEFQDVRFTKTPEESEELFRQAREYYRAASYGKIDLEWYIYPKVIRLPGEMAQYGAPGQGTRDNAAAYWYDVIVTAWNEGVDFAGYWHLVAIHAGGDEAFTHNPNDIWSHCACLGPKAEEMGDIAEFLRLPTRDGGKQQYWGLSTFGENEPIGVLTHEFGHSLGLPDLYIMEGGTPMGTWGLMCAGSHLPYSREGVATRPSDFSALSKWILGWVEAKLIEPSGTYVLYPLSRSGEPKLLALKLGEYQYLFIEARLREGLDSALTDWGVLVYKVDVSKGTGEGIAFLSDANPNTPVVDRGLDLFKLVDAPLRQGLTTARMLLDMRGEPLLPRRNSVIVNLGNQSVQIEAVWDGEKFTVKLLPIPQGH